MAEGGEVPKIDKLSRTNYPLWKFNIENWILGKGWKPLLDGTATPANLPNFGQLNAKVKAVIGISLDQEHLSQVLHCETAFQMWTTICATQERNTASNKMLASHEYYSQLTSSSME